MPKELSLERIDADIAAGDLGKARDRLQGLIGSFPNDIALRSRLADVYSQLHYPDMAGCYWYLEEDQTAQIEQALSAFKKRCGGDPWLMLHSIKFRGESEALPSHAHKQLNQLVTECKKKYGSYPEFQGTGKASYTETAKSKVFSRVFAAVCFALLFFIIACAIIGFNTIVRWVL
jgi:hypothetical protein